MLAKLIVHGSDRGQAIARMRQALRDLVLLGVDHNGAYLERVLGLPAFATAQLHTHFLEEHREQLGLAEPGDAERLALVACAALAARRATLDAPQPYAAMGSWRN
jgi:acetyl/propionyl-CoA carboxylase alpha subunit